MTASKFFDTKEKMILMDGDVLYHEEIFKRLVNSNKKNCFLLDRNIEEGEEPVKICIKKMVPRGQTIWLPRLMIWLRLIYFDLLQIF